MFSKKVLFFFIMFQTTSFCSSIINELHKIAYILSSVGEINTNIDQNLYENSLTDLFSKLIETSNFLDEKYEYACNNTNNLFSSLKQELNNNIPTIESKLTDLMNSVYNFFNIQTQINLSDFENVVLDLNFSNLEYSFDIINDGIDNLLSKYNNLNDKIFTNFKFLTNINLLQNSAHSWCEKMKYINNIDNLKSYNSLNKKQLEILGKIFKKSETKIEMLKNILIDLERNYAFNEIKNLLEFGLSKTENPNEQITFAEIFSKILSDENGPTIVSNKFVYDKSSICYILCNLVVNLQRVLDSFKISR